MNLDGVSIDERIGRDWHETVQKMLDSSKSYVASCTFRTVLQSDGRTKHCTCNDKPVAPGGRPKFDIEVSASGNISGDVSCGSGFSTNEDIETSQLDLDNNGVINTVDMLMVSDLYGTSVSSEDSQNVAGGKSPDINGDGIVNALDLSYLINAFGTEVN